jgi:flagellar biosynthetic protein FliR
MGAMVMLVPGLGEGVIPPRARLAIALAITLCLTPTLARAAPAMPADALGWSGLIVRELLIGLMIGGAARMLMSALATAGQIMGLESGLAFAQTADPSLDQTGQAFAVFIGLLGIVLIFATDLHHDLIRGLAGSYGVFALGGEVPVQDAAALALDTFARSFLVGFQVAAPLIVAGLVFRLGLGVLARLIPTIQVFFVVLPLQVLGAFVIIGLGLASGMLVWLDSVEAFLRGLS